MLRRVKKAGNAYNNTLLLGHQNRAVSAMAGTRTKFRRNETLGSMDSIGKNIVVDFRPSRIEQGRSRADIFSFGLADAYAMLPSQDGRAFSAALPQSAAVA